MIRKERTTMEQELLADQSSRPTFRTADGRPVSPTTRSDPPPAATPSTPAAHKDSAAKLAWDKERGKLERELRAGRLKADKLSARADEAIELKELTVMLQSQVAEAESSKQALVASVRSLLDVSGQMVVATDRHTKVKEWNSAAALLTGSDRATVEGKKLFEALTLSPKDKPLIAAMIKEASGAAAGAKAAEITVKMNGVTDLLLSVHPWISNTGCQLVQLLECCSAAALQQHVWYESIRTRNAVRVQRALRVQRAPRVQRARRVGEGRG